MLQINMLPIILMVIVIVVIDCSCFIHADNAFLNNDDKIFGCYLDQNGRFSLQAALRIILHDNLFIIVVYR